MKRLALIAALLIVLAAGALLWFLRFSLDGRVKAAIEEYGTAMALAPVRVEGVHIDLRAGRGTIRGITVANPDGFRPGTAVSLGEIVLAVEPASLRSDPIVLSELRVGAPRVTVVLTAEGETNVEALRKNVRRYPERVAAREGREAPEPPPPPATAPAAAPEPPAPERRLRVRELTIAEGVITLDASALGREPEELTLGSVELRDLGGERGAPPEQIGRRVADALIARTARAVAGAELKRTLRDKGGELGEKLGELLERGLGR